MELTYRQENGLLYPNLDPPQQNLPLGKYALLRRTHLKEHRPSLYSKLLMTGKLMGHLMEIDSTAHQAVEQTVSQLLETQPPPNQNSDPLGWISHMNGLKHQAEEEVVANLVYSN